MKYLIFENRYNARVKSRQAYSTLRPDDDLDSGTLTVALWTSFHHPIDGRTALMIPDTPIESGIDISQEDYVSLLTESDRQSLIDKLPSDWHTNIDEDA